MIRRARRWAGMVGAAAVAAGAGVSAHVPLQPPGSARAGVQINLNVGGQPLSVQGIGECVQSGTARAARTWTARRRDAQRDVAVTVSRTPDGRDQFSVQIGINGKLHRVNTAHQGVAAGAGQATFELKGRGGVFTIYAVADSGARISGQVTCSAFWRA